MKKIVLVSTSTTLGGAEKTLYTLTTLLDPKKFEVAAVISLKPAGIYAAKLSDAGFRVESLNLGKRPSLPDFKRLGNILRELKPDIVHAFLYQAIQMCRVVKKFSAPAWALLSSPRVNYRTRSLWTLALDRCLKKADNLLITESLASRDFLVQRLGYAPEKIKTVYNGVDLAGWPASRLDRRQHRLELRLASEDILVGAAGRLDRQKGQEFLIEAFRQLKGQHLRCVILGEGPGREELEKKIRRTRLESQVWLIGERRDMPSWLSAFDIFVLPSLWEGLPNSLLEAMALGLPVIASAVDGVKEIIEDGVNGLLVPPKKTTLLARKISDLARDPAQRLRLGAAARETISKKFSLIEMISSYERIYEGIAVRN